MAQLDDTIVAIQSANLVPALAAFVAVVDAGSFTRAAKLTGSDRSGARSWPSCAAAIPT